MFHGPSEIKNLRLKLGLTQTELAGRSGTSQSLIAKIEAGRTDASYSNVKKILDCLEELDNKSAPTAKEMMNRKVFFVDKNDSASKAIWLMRSHGFSQLPVLDRHHAIGSISEKTIVDKMAAGVGSKELSRLKCGELLGEAFPTVSTGTPLPAVSELLKHHSAVLVRQGEKIAGIISKADLLKIIKS